MRSSNRASARIFLVLLAATQVNATGCASIIHGTHQDVEIRSDPAGARIIIYPSGQEAQTPAKVSLLRNTAYTVRFELIGYETRSEFINRVTSGAVMGNILIGGMIGRAVDADSGAGYKLVPDLLEVELTPVASGGEADSGEIEQGR